MARTAETYRWHEERAELEELLAPFARTDSYRYREARWLRSEFTSAIWSIESGTAFEIDWSVSLPDGESLTSARHAGLCETLKRWLIARTHSDSTGGRLLAPMTELNVIRSTLYCIDYVLLNAAALGLTEHGLMGLSENDLRALIAKAGAHRRVSVAIYEWPQRIEAFLRAQIATMSPETINRACAKFDGLSSDIPVRTDRLTSLNTDEVIAARAWLATNGGYKSVNRGRFMPAPALFVAALYSNTLAGPRLTLPVVEELCYRSGPGRSGSTEFRHAWVRNHSDEGPTRTRHRLIVAAIGALSLLRAEGLPAPMIDIDSLRKFAGTLPVKADGRYRTLPQETVLEALRIAIEYVIQRGDALVDSYLGAARAAESSDQSIALLSQAGDFDKYLTTTCRAMGTSQWTIEELPAARRGAKTRISDQEWRGHLRENLGLYESLRVLFGAIQIVVGLLSARRVGALLGLMSNSCLDSSRTRLIFENMKSGPVGLREKEARPIPPFAVRCIELLQRMHLQSGANGVAIESIALFAYPQVRNRGFVDPIVAAEYNQSLDYFCDWAELPLDREGRRYYIRQHQLRRFFAMLFFWGGGFGGLDTLRWFLGHTNAVHLWNYITETVPGATIRSVAAEWAAYGVKHATKEAELLAEEIKRHFGTADFTALDEEALCAHLEDLISEGRLVIEPQFLDGGNQYRIAVVLRPRNST
jgi:hypothetical protein